MTGQHAHQSYIIQPWKIDFMSNYTFLFLFCTTFIFISCQTDKGASSPDPTDYQPDRDLGNLFVDVQTANVLNDYKTFVDCSPKTAPSEIISLYESEKSNTDFDLKEFVLEHFNLPPALEKKEINKKADMIAHLKNHWTYLSRIAQHDERYTTLINLPEPYVVPGGRFREMFYWDSYFTIIGLLESDEDELALGMIKNFDFLIKKYGFIPNGNRTYFATRSQPPFFAEMLTIYAEKHGMESILEYLPSLQKEYEFWTMQEESKNAYSRTVTLENGTLNRYNGTLTVPRAEGYGKEKRWAAQLPENERPIYHRHLRAVCESGWDFSSRWFADGKNKVTTNCEDIIPVCLNSLLFGMEKQLERMHEHEGNIEKVEYFNELSAARIKAMQTYLWSEEVGYFKDYNFVLKQQTDILSLATLYPLYFQMASQEQADQIADVVREKLLFAGGVATTTVNTGEQWDYPNGWAPLQWITVMGLANYGHTDLAGDIARRWLTLNQKVFEEEGKMMEKYNVVDTTLMGGGGEYKNQDGFGWTNGVALGLHRFLAELNSLNK